MYATEKYVKHEAKHLLELINTLATEHGGDINELSDRINMLSQQLNEIKNMLEKTEDKNVF